MAMLSPVPFAAAQTAAKPTFLQQPAFEAVSIHMVDPHAAGGASQDDGLLSVSTFPSNLFFLRNAPLAFLVQLAYNIDSQDQIAAMPGWMESREYAISAKVEGDQQLSLEQMRPMLQRLLEERFHFAAHRETKLMPGFALVLAKGGSKLRPSKAGVPPFAQILPDCIDGGSMKASQIAGVLAHRAGQPVRDETGLTGTYDFRVAYARANDADPQLPDFFTAIQEQLGLRLQPSKVPVDILVIDHVDGVPTDN